MLRPNPNVVINRITSNIDSFQNTYFHSEIDLDYNENYRNRIYVVFNKKTIKQELVDLLASLDNYIRAEFILDFIIFVFKIPDVFLNDFLLFKEGQYSKFSKEYKDLITKCWPYKLNLKEILYPTKDRIYQLQLILGTNEKITETQGKPDTIKETFKMSNYFKIEENK